MRSREIRLNKYTTDDRGKCFRIVRKPGILEGVDSKGEADTQACSVRSIVSVDPCPAVPMEYDCAQNPPPHRHVSRNNPCCSHISHAVLHLIIRHPHSIPALDMLTHHRYSQQYTKNILGYGQSI